MFSDDIWANGFLLWPAMLNFDSFIVCWNNLHPSFNYTFVKAKVNKDEKRNLFQILIFLDINAILNSKNEISKDTNTHDYLAYDSADPESCKKNLPYNLAERIIVFVNDSEKVKLKLNELKIWLKNNKYPDDIISNAFYNAKLQLPAPKPNNNSTKIPFVTYFHEDTGN